MIKFSYILGLLAFITAGAPVAAQQPAAFTWEAKLPAVVQTGFYNIALTPDILSYGFPWSIRLLKDTVEVPYLFREQTGGYDAAQFEAFDIISYDRLPKSASTLIFRNKGGDTLTHIEVVFKNAWITKTMQISGSNDQHNWFGVTDKFVFDPASAAGDEAATTLVKRLAMPASNYAWYKLVIDDSTSAPILVEKIGRYRTNRIAADYEAVPAPHLNFPGNGNPRESRVLLQFNRPYRISKLVFNIAAPGLYHRDAAIGIPNKDGTINRIQSFILSSDKPAQVILDNSGTYKNLYILIQNQDDVPLQFRSISAWQLRAYLTAYLETGRPYTLKGGNSALEAPVYDLAYFRDSVPANLPVVQPGAPAEIAPKLPRAAVEPFFKYKWVIWVAIAGIIAFLAYVVLRMLKEMEAGKNNGSV